MFSTSDKIRIQNLQVFAHHGVFPEEKEKGQNFYVNAELYLPTQPAGQMDDLELSVNYAEVCQFITDWMQSHTVNLLETVAEQLVQEILRKYQLLQGMTLEIRKPEAPIPLPFESVSVEITRFWHVAYLSMGSNMGDSCGYLEMAAARLNEQKHTRLLRTSSVLLTKPYGGVEQNDFLNNIAVVKTLLGPEELLRFIHSIEKEAGRKREIHWGPRTLDIDIIFYDDLVYENEQGSGLMIPHIDMQNRFFVLKPLSEVAPDKRHPLFHKTVKEMLLQLNPEQCS